MPASAGELAQFKAWLRAMTQLIEAIEARDKAEQLVGRQDSAPAPRGARIP